MEKDEKELVVRTGNVVYIFLVLMFISALFVAFLTWIIIFIIAIKRKQLGLILNFYVLFNLILICYTIIYILLDSTMSVVVSIVLFSWLLISFSNNMNSWQIKRLLKNGYEFKKSSEYQMMPENEMERIKKIKYPMYVIYR